MLRIFNIIQKNLKLLIRSKASASIIILGPLLLVLLVGLAFSGSSLNNINVGVYSSSYSELTNILVTTMQDNQFVVTKTTSELECIQGVKYGKFHVCAVFPPDLSVGTANITSTIVFHVDYSRVNLVYSILDTISKKVSVKASELSGELVQVLLDTLENSRISLIEKKDSITELSTSASQTKRDADNIVSEANALSLTFNINQTEEDLNTLENLTNSTSALNIIDDIREDFDAFNTGLAASLEAKQKIKEQGTAISDASTASTQKLTQLKSSTETIIGNIESIKIRERETILNPIKTQITPISEKKSHWNYLFPTLLIIMVAFVSLLLATSLVTKEKATKAYFRNFITPTSDIIFLLGTYLSCLFILVVQLIIIFGQAWYFLRAELLSVLGVVSIFIILIASIFILIGMVIGYLFKSQETAVLASMSLAGFMLFFSNTILPIESIPPSLKVLASFNPFVLGEAVLKKLILFQAPLSTLTFEMFMLIGYLALFVVLTF